LFLLLGAGAAAGVMASRRKRSSDASGPGAGPPGSGGTSPLDRTVVDSSAGTPPTIRVANGRTTAVAAWAAASTSDSAAPPEVAGRVSRWAHPIDRW